MKIKAIITGSTGMVGEGVLLTCLASPDVESVLLINRRPCGISHAKIHEVIVKDLFALDDIEKLLTGYNACYFCLGTTSVGKKENDYKIITYDLTMYFAAKLAYLNPGMIFCYVSGQGTDSTEKGRLAWARIKGKTENDLRKLPFKRAYALRPGYIQPMKGMRNVHGFYKPLKPFYPLFNILFPKYVCTIEQLGLAMINISQSEDAPEVLECRDIKKIAQ